MRQRAIAKTTPRRTKASHLATTIPMENERAFLPEIPKLPTRAMPAAIPKMHERANLPAIPERLTRTRMFKAAMSTACARAPATAKVLTRALSTTPPVDSERAVLSERTHRKGASQPSGETL